MAKAPAPFPAGSSFRSSRGLPRVGSVDQVALEERAAALAERSIKREAKLFALDLAVRMMDLTTLEGRHAGKVSALASKAIRPDPSDRRSLGRGGLRLPEPRPDRAVERRRARASRSPRSRPRSPPASARRTSRSPRCATSSSWAPTRSTWSSTAAPSSRAATPRSTTRSCQVKEASGEAHLKVILETGELGTYDNVRRASPARDGGRRRLHQDLDREAAAGGDAAGDARACSRRSATSTRRPGARWA